MKYSLLFFYFVYTYIVWKLEHFFHIYDISFILFLQAKEKRKDENMENNNEKQLEEMPSILPNREYQNRVVKLLDSISEKISINNQINDNLLVA